jgi:hypothetical protein
MTGGDLIIAAPWLVFAGGLTAIGWRLAAGRDRRPRRPTQRPGAGTRPGPDRPGSRPAPPGTGRAKPDRGDLPAARCPGSHHQARVKPGRGRLHVISTCGTHRGHNRAAKLGAWPAQRPHQPEAGHDGSGLREGGQTCPLSPVSSRA